MNTWKRPRLEQKQKRAIRKTTSPELALKEAQKERLITSRSPDGETARQIDYLMINRRYRNSARRAQTIAGWQENMAQQKQPSVIRMDICPKLMKN